MTTRKIEDPQKSPTMASGEFKTAQVIGLHSKRDELLESAIVLFTQSKFWNVPLAAVAKHAGVSIGSMSNYFPTKELLVRDVMIHLKREMIVAAREGFDIEADFRDQLELLWCNGLKWGLANWARFQLMDQIRVCEEVSQHDLNAVGDVYADTASLFEYSINQGLIERLSPYLLSEIMYRQAQAAAEFLMWTDGLTEPEINAHIHTCFDVFWRGIKSK